MKRTIGVIRKIDSTGRICIPKDFRKLVPVDKVEIVLVQDDNNKYTIVMKPIRK